MEAWSATDWARVIVAAGAAVAFVFVGIGWFIYLCHRGSQDPREAEKLVAEAELTRARRGD